MAGALYSVAQFRLVSSMRLSSFIPLHGRIPCRYTCSTAAISPPWGIRELTRRWARKLIGSISLRATSYKKGSFVALTDADFKHANIKTSETIEINTFCDAEEVSPIYFEKPYYLDPAKGGAKVYSLLRQALEAMGKVAIATFVMHQRQHLCVIIPQASGLVFKPSGLPTNWCRQAAAA
jgi:hypothetical protein